MEYTKFNGLLDQLLIPRANGSEGLRETASFLESTLQASAAELEIQSFIATPYGIQLLFAALFLIALAFAVAMLRGRLALALVLSLTSLALLFVEQELLWSPISGLFRISEQNIVATFLGRIGGPTLVIGAHYDTATQFGDHHTWARWGLAMTLGQFAGLILPMAGLWQRRMRQKELPDKLALAGVALAVIPSGVMTWFLAAGPVLAVPSPGALDNGTSVAVLLRLAEDLSARPADAPTTIKLAFFAAEEERGFGSWHFASTLATDAPVLVINLDNIAASEQLAYGTREGFIFSQYPAAKTLVEMIDRAQVELGANPLIPLTYPLGTMTDARSFLAHEIPALTLGAAIDGRWPRHLHSARDSRDRVSLPAMEHTRKLLNAVVAQLDRQPLIAQRRGEGLR
jgi:hypothetical protein